MPMIAIKDVNVAPVQELTNICFGVGVNDFLLQFVLVKVSENKNKCGVYKHLHSIIHKIKELVQTEINQAQDL